MATPNNLSKSKLAAFRQCPRRLWLEIHKPELRADSAATLASFAVGHTVGEIARALFDPKGQGLLIDVKATGYAEAFAQTRQALQGKRPIFEAGFAAGGALAFADVFLPAAKSKSGSWRMIEVKSSGEVKAYQQEDLAIQTYIVRKAGVSLAGAWLAHVDTKWIYPGDGDYRGLLVEHDLTDEVLARTDEVEQWIADAHVVAKRKREPSQATGPQCTDPFECGFFAHCQEGEPVVEHPVAWLPDKRSKVLKEHVARKDIVDMSQVPDTMLNAQQLLVKQCTLNNEAHLDRKGARQALAEHPLPGLFLDFETITFVVPIWPGTSPYQKIPFQFSLHLLDDQGNMSHTEFLDLSGNDPSERFALALVKACTAPGPIFVYNKGFEGARIKELAERFPRHARKLLAVRERLVDLQPVTKKHYYHPSQQGSWSIKKVLPAMAPELTYDALDGVQNGGAAMDAYLEAIASTTTGPRKAEIEQQLLAYCRLDTFAMIRVWAVLAGRKDLSRLKDKD